MELIIYAPTENQFIKEIDFNFEESKQEMTVRLERYKDLVYTDASIKDAKTDRATLNKFKEAIENKRKEVKKQCLAPYEEFEKKIKELTSLVDAPILAIDGQVKTFEQAQKDEKKALIKTYYDEHIESLIEILPFEKLFIDKWLNASVKVKEAYDTIDSTIAKVIADLLVIADLKTEFELQIKDTYLRTLDLSMALTEKTRLEQQKARLEEYQRQQEAQKDVKPEVEVIINAETQVEPIEEVQEAIIVMDFRVWTTASQLNALKGFLKQNNIKYGKVE